MEISDLSECAERDEVGVRIDFRRRGAFARAAGI
jgi:hypothetical protein